MTCSSTDERTTSGLPRHGEQATRTQYHDDGNLNARIALHARFSTNPYGWQRWIFDAIAPVDDARVLELGCGPGTLWSANHQRIPTTCDITLTDFSPGMVQAARRNLQAPSGCLRFAVADAQAIPFDCAVFDVAIANHMLYHVRDRRQALEEIARVLKRGGALFATTVGETHMQELWALVEPFVPGISARSNTASRPFTLENGIAQLSTIFDDVQRYDYVDDLEVTEVEPIIAYLKSTMTFGALANDVCLQKIRQRVTAQIKSVGAFHIHKSSGLLTARRRAGGQ